jgi:hypothetical protein
MTTKLPRCIYKRFANGQDVYYVSVTTDGLRENLGTFMTLQAAIDARNQHKIKLTLASSLGFDVATPGQATAAALQDLVDTSWPAEQQARWKDLLSMQDPTSLDSSADMLVRDDNDELVTIPAAIVAEYIASYWAGIANS